MKIKIVSLFILLIMSAICTVSGAIRRVGFNGIPLTNVDYTNFVDAQNDASPDDTIQYYLNITFNKMI